MVVPQCGCVENLYLRFDARFISFFPDFRSMGIEPKALGIKDQRNVSKFSTENRYC